jgi:predicted DNA-binding transcriptional regulator AlpA
VIEQRVSPQLINELVALVADALAPKLAEELSRAIPPPQVAEPWRLVGVVEVAAMLGRSRRWVHGAVKERGLPYIRLDGGALAFDPHDVKEWARGRRVPAVESDPLADRLQGPREGASDAGLRHPRLTAKQKVDAR